MKALTLLATALMAGLPALSQADDVSFRQLDDMTFSTMNDARELRWLIRSEFVESPNVGLLLNDSQMLLMQLRGFEDSLFREFPVQVLFNNLNQVRASAAQLRFRLSNPCPTCVHPDFVFYGGERFVIEQPRPEIVLPTDLALEILTVVEGKLQTMEDVLLGRALPAVEADGFNPAIEDVPEAPLNDGVILDGELGNPPMLDVPAAGVLVAPPGQI